MRKAMIIYFEENTSDHIIREIQNYAGKLFKDVKSIEIVEINVKPDANFPTYEGKGVCTLCGSLTCSGNCFK